MPTATLEADAVLSDAVLQAARQIVSSHPFPVDQWAGCGSKNPPLLTLLDQLVNGGLALLRASRSRFGVMRHHQASSGCIGIIRVGPGGLAHPSLTLSLRRRQGAQGISKVTIACRRHGQDVLQGDVTFLCAQGLL